MSVINDFKKMYHEWRRQSLPPSNADIHSRHEVIVRRLDQIEQAITNRFPETVSWPAQQGEILAVLRLLEPKKVVDYKKIRVGSEGGGGYVQIDDLEGISHALAFGVSGNDSWDLAMAKAGIPVEQFDHAIERAPSSHPLLHFHRKVISVDATAETATLSDLVAEHSKPGAPDLILKIDIEGCEWDVFDRATDAVLSRLAQVICEFHDLSHLTAPAFRARARRVFEKLDKHFAPVHRLKPKPSGGRKRENMTQAEEKALVHALCQGRRSRRNVEHPRSQGRLRKGHRPRNQQQHGL
jgi:FkbM family methyltransferase